MVGNLLGTATGAIVAGGASRLAWGGMGGGGRTVTGTIGASRSSASQLTLPMSVGVPTSRGAEQLSLPLAVPQPTRGEA